MVLSLVKKEVEEVSFGKLDFSKLEEGGDELKLDVEREWEGFFKDVLEKWFVLKKRNFWCI